jgi:hypothetical protein
MAILLCQVCYIILCFAAEDISVSVDAGFDGNAKINFTNQFKFYLSSKENFSGQLVMTMQNQNQEKIEYATNIELPAGTKKEYMINAPIYSIEKKMDYRILNGNKEVLKGNFEIKKILPPEALSIGVLCEDKNAFSEYSVAKNFYFNSITYQMNLMYSRRTKFGYYGGGGTIMKSSVMQPMYYGQPTAIEPNMVKDSVEIIKLDKSNFPDNLDSLEGLNIIIIDNFDTSKLDKVQINALKEWISEGRILMLCNGSQYKKVNSGLPEEIKFFKGEESKGILFPQSMKKFGDFNNTQVLNVALGKYTLSQVVLIEGDVPLVTINNVKNGQVINTAFSMYESPYNTWNGRIELFKFIIQKSLETMKPKNNNLVETQDQANILSQTASSVPNDRMPPITTILVILFVYLLIVSPVLYFILKKKDKKEYTWIFVPLISIIFVGIIYTIGYKTKFTRAVASNVSLIELSKENKTEKIISAINIFNNKNGTLKIQYPKDFPLELNNMMMGYGYRGMIRMPNQVVSSKIIFGDEISYELYHASLWTNKMLLTTKEQKSEGSILLKFNLKNKEAEFKLKNESVYSLKNTYILFASNIYDAGELKAGEEKQISGVVDNSLTQDFTFRFLEDRFGFAALSKLNNTKLAREESRKRNLLQGIFMNVLNFNNNPYNSNRKFPITVVGLNDTPIKYPIKANDEIPDTYNTNVIIQNYQWDFEKGRIVTLPSGLIKPFISGEGTIGFNIEQNSNIRFMTDGTVNVSYELPSNLKLQKLILDFDKLKLSIKNASTFNMQKGPAVNSNNVIPITNDIVEVKIQNHKTGNWENLKDTATITTNPGDYVASDKVNLKISTSGAAQYQGQLLISCPEIEISGVRE